MAVNAPEAPCPVIPARQACAIAIKAAMPAKTKTEAAEKVGRTLNDTTFRGAWSDVEDAGGIVRVGGGWDLSSRHQTLDNPTTTNPDSVAVR